MIKKFEKYSEIEELVLGIDLDGVLNDFTEGFNIVYRKYFPYNYYVPTKEINDWTWYHGLDYNGEDPDKWFFDHKHEGWLVSEPYPGAIDTMKSIYRYTQNNGILLRIVSQQIGENAQRGAIDWMKKYGIKYDDIAFPKRSKEKWNNAHIMVDDSPHVLSYKPDDKVSIKVIQKWNRGIGADFQIRDITYLSPRLVEDAFEKLKHL